MFYEFLRIQAACREGEQCNRSPEIQLRRSRLFASLVLCYRTALLSLTAIVSTLVPKQTAEETRAPSVVDLIKYVMESWKLSD